MAKPDWEQFDEDGNWVGDSTGEGAPKPANFDAMVAARDDPVAFAMECRRYEQQLAEAGYSDQWTTTGRVNHNVSIY